jgi:very-short-patch-repair endonuclease
VRALRRDTKEYLIPLAREMRKKPTPAEAKLWAHLRGSRLNGCRFYRQYPIDRFIADFYCPKYNLVIELDGSIHGTENQQARDAEKDADFKGRGFALIRFRNDQVLYELDSVLNELSLLLNLLSQNAKQTSVNKH